MIIQNTNFNCLYMKLNIEYFINNGWKLKKLVYVYIYIYIYRVFHEERSIFWEVILSKNVYMNVCPIPNSF